MVVERDVMDPKSAERWQVELLERRRVVYEQLLWQIPSASFAGQAFLLTIVLGTGKTPTDRFLASLFGLAAAVGVLIAYVKHRYSEEAYAEWINAAELHAGRPKLHVSQVRGSAYADRPVEDRFSWEFRAVRHLAKPSAFNVWVVLLSVFVIGDLVLVMMSLVELSGGGTVLR